jgi:hypothetical protein
MTAMRLASGASAVRALQHDERLRITSKPIYADELLCVLRTARCVTLLRASLRCRGR